jgi:hypothetical protein
LPACPACRRSALKLANCDIHPTARTLTQWPRHGGCCHGEQNCSQILHFGFCRSGGSIASTWWLLKNIVRPQIVRLNYAHAYFPAISVKQILFGSSSFQGRRLGSIVNSIK